MIQVPTDESTHFANLKQNDWEPLFQRWLASNISIIWMQCNFPRLLKLTVSFSHLKLSGGKTEILIISRRQQKGETKPQTKIKVKVEITAEERRMMGTGNTSGNVRRCKKRTKEGRKGKQVKLLMLATIFLPGQVFQSLVMTWNTPNCQKQPITQCGLNDSMVCVHVWILGFIKSDRGKSSRSIWTERGLDATESFLHAAS